MSKISVIMPAYNSGTYIGRAIDSVLAQTVSDLELIVIDDGSTDETLQVANDFARVDSRVKVIQQPNSGRPGIARNAGLAVANGELLSFLDADDFWDPRRLELLLRGLDTHSEWVAVFHDLQYVDEHGKKIPETYLADVGFEKEAKDYLVGLDDNWFECSAEFYLFMHLRYAAIHTDTVLIARDRTDIQPLRFDTSFVCCEDTDLWFRLARGRKMGYLAETLASYRQHGSGISRNLLQMSSDTVKLHVRGYEEVGPRMDEPRRRLYQKKIARAWALLAFRHQEGDAMPAARQAYIQSIRWDLSFQATVSLCKCLMPFWLRRILKAMVRRRSEERNSCQEGGVHPRVS